MDRDLLKSLFHRTVIVAGLGYFVDIYDLLLFSIVSTQSVNALVPGITDAARAQTILTLLNWQMGGMLLGGVLWGILGDKKGRLTVLFGSISLYSIANIANGFVTSIPMYAALRFVSGVGLAGELGAGITLVSEVLKKEHRGYGTALVSALGISGAVIGGFVAKVFDWRVAYFVGGGLGLVLLITRISMAESFMFDKTKDSNVVRGSLRMLLGDWGRASRFIRTTLVGLPIWCLIALFITISPTISKDLGIVGINVSIFAVQWFYGGASLGGLFWGSLSQKIGSRKNTTIAALTFTSFFVFVYFFSYGVTPLFFYVVCGFLGFGTGYWAVFVTMAAEQFGTNLRATVATIVPNLIRGTTVPLSLAWKYFSPTFGAASTAMVLAAVSTLIALFSVRSLEETHSRDLNFVEGGTPTAMLESTPAPAVTSSS